LLNKQATWHDSDRQNVITCFSTVRKLKGILKWDKNLATSEIKSYAKSPRPNVSQESRLSAVCGHFRYLILKHLNPCLTGDRFFLLSNYSKSSLAPLFLGTSISPAVKILGILKRHKPLLKMRLIICPLNQSSIQ